MAWVAPTLASRRVRGALSWLLVVVLAAGVALAGLPAAVAAAPVNRYVATTGSNTGDCSASLNPCATLGYALTQAAAGDTITIAAGPYNGTNVTIDKNITIQGAGAAATILDGSSDGAGANPNRVIVVNGGVTATIDGVTIQHGVAPDNNGGGGVLSSGTLTLSNSTLTNNSATYGGGLRVLSGALTLTNVTVTNNEATNGNGGGLDFPVGAITISDSTIGNNRATGSGGGIGNNAALTITNTTISGNIGAQGGGLASYTSVTLTGSAVGSNTATAGSGGGIFAQGQELTLTDSTVGGNTAPNDVGGGIAMLGPNLTLTNTTVTVNTAASSGGGVFTNVGTVTTVTGGAFRGNTSTGGDGGGLALQGPATITGATIDGNKVGAGRSGGGLLFLTSGATAASTVADSTISNNTAGDVNSYGYGGGLWFFGDSGATLTLTNDTITKNTATGGNGGGVDIPTGAVTITGGTISNNTAGTYGGGIGNGGVLTATGVTISGNTALLGGGLVTYGTLTLTNSTVSGNTASGGYGGGIFGDYRGTGAITGSTISGNTSYIGSAIFNRAPLTIVNSTISGNTGVFGAIANEGVNNNGTIMTAALTVRFSTIAGNLLSNTYSGSTAGIYAWQFSTTVVSDSIVASPAPNCSLSGGSVTSGSHNVFTDNSCGPTASDQVVSDAKLGPLADNGGPTQTQALLPGSPAIDVADNTVCPATDQRGVSRPQGGVCDSGAFELATVTIVPTISALSPGATLVNESITLIVIGTRFANGLSTVWFGGTALPTTYISATQLTATIPANLLMSAGTVQVTVVNGPPGGGTSNPLPFTIKNPVPTLNGLSQTSVTAGSGDTPLTLTGTNFAPGATVLAGDTTLMPVGVTGTSIQVILPAALLTQAGTLAIAVNNPGPGGGASNSLSLAVNPAGAGQLRIVAGNAQSAPVTTTFATALQVEVRDQYGNLVPGASVTFSAPASGASGAFAGGGASASVTADGNGVATAPAFTANGVAGSYNVLASANGAIVPFTLMNMPGPAARFALAAPATTAAGSPLTVTVTAQDAQGNTATGYTGTVRLTSSDGQAGLPVDYAFAGADRGSHAFSVTLATAGQQTVTATDTVNGSISGQTSVAVGVAAPASVSATAGAGQQAQVGTTFASPLQATVRDASGNPVAGVSVTFRAPASGPSATFGGSLAATVVTDNAGLATAPALTANGTAGAFTVSATASGVATPATFALTNTAAPVPDVTLTVRVDGDGSGTVTPGVGTHAYPSGDTASLSATAAGGSTFLGWTVDGTFVGFGVPLTLPMTANHTVTATFVPTPRFSDVAPGDPYATAISQLAARGIIHGYGNGAFGPSDLVVRAQTAALIARTFGWQTQFHGNPFPDRCDPAQPTNCVDDELWNDVAVLNFFNVARGYTDPTTCQAAGTTTPCYLPRGDVLHIQVVSFITRAMEAAGLWTEVAQDDPALFANVPASTNERLDLVTYLHYVQPYTAANGLPLLPGLGSTAAFPGFDQPATRGYIAQIIWQAYAAYWGTNHVP